MKDATSWYTGTNVPGKPRAVLQYLGGVDVYGAKLNHIQEEGYPGLERAAMREGAAA
jgi:hypothetical protein